MVASCKMRLFRWRGLVGAEIHGDGEHGAAIHDGGQSVENRCIVRKGEEIHGGGGKGAETLGGGGKEDELVVMNVHFRHLTAKKAVTCANESFKKW